MSELFQNFDQVQAYIDDLLIMTKGSWEYHLLQLSKALQRLQEAGLKVNAPKSFFGKAECEYLGFWITRNGVQPLPAKVKAITQIKTPKTKKELRSFIGMFNFY